jgi:hypothetical protein
MTRVLPVALLAAVALVVAAATNLACVVTTDPPEPLTRAHSVYPA